MLQQTRVAAALPYFDRWMARFPTIAALAEADEQEVLSLWQGLGYYRRCRALLDGARLIRARGMPSSAAGWLCVPGVGRYTAAAIASIALGEAAPLVDGNVERVVARLGAWPQGGPALHRRAWEWAAKNMRISRPGDWNQALMELGATICTPVSPRCQECPLASGCAAYRQGEPERYPARAPVSPPTRLFHLVWVPIREGKLGLRRIPPGEWWAGMWEFPRVDASQSIAKAEARLHEIVGPCKREALGVIRHTVTTHRIEVRASLAFPPTCRETLQWRHLEALERLPMPAAQRKLLVLTMKKTPTPFPFVPE
jgi:A/G-specific adenine glycosylase